MSSQVRSRAALILVLLVATFSIVALFVWWYSKPRPFEESEAPAPAVIDYGKSFDWRDAIPHLYQAAAFPSEEAMKILLQNTAELRTNIARVIQTERRRSGEPDYHAKLGDPALEAVITNKIDELIRQRLQSRGKITSVDCSLRQPFPFSAIIALKSHAQPYASLIFELSQGSLLTENGVEMEYGPPQRRTIDAESFSLMTYQIATKSYIATGAFQADPRSSQVRRISISVQRLRR